MDIYLDHNANSPMRPDAIAALVEALETGATNPGSGHARAFKARDLFENARCCIAPAVGAQATEIVFTSGGTESNNLAICGLLEARSPKNQLVTVTTEHPSVLKAAAAVEKGGAELVLVGVDRNGRLNFDALAESIDEQTAVVTVMLANNETGVLQDIPRIAELCRARGVPLHCDAVQAVGKIPVSFADLGVASASFTAHKLGGPIGIGALYIAKGVDIRPRSWGGSQEGGLRPGTQPFALAHSFAHALEVAVDRLDVMANRVQPLRDKLEAEILGRVPDAVVLGGGAPRLPNTSLVAFPNRDAADILLQLDRQGVSVGTGAACGTHERTPSHVLVAMGRSAADARGTLRLSLSSWTTESEITAVFEALLGILQQ